MGFFDNNDNVQEYIKMAEGYDGSDLIRVLRKYLPEGSTLLELGMGPGKDLDILKESFVVTGSDNSSVFVDLYQKKNPAVDVMVLDAITIDTEKKFDCIYSNKVLVHLERNELIQSLQRQKEVLKKNGLLFHSFWYGDKREEHHGLLFNYYTENGLKEIIGIEFDIIEMEKYSEIEEGDSKYVILRKKN